MAALSSARGVLCRRTFDQLASSPAAAARHGFPAAVAVSTRHFYGQDYHGGSGTVSDVIDGHAGELTVNQRFYEPGKYFMIGDMPKDKFDRLVRGAEHRTRVHQPPMVYGDSETAWLGREGEMWDDGRVRLAKIMGVEPDTFSPEDIKKSLNYLLPSQLWDKKCRPRMDHPLTFFPDTATSDVDLSKPLTALGAYTGSPGYHELLFDIYEQAETIQRKMASAGFRELMQEFNKSNDQPYVWLSQTEMTAKLHDELTAEQYRMLTERLDKIANHRLSYVATKFLKKWSKETKKEEIIRDTSLVQEGRKFSVFAWASVKPGTGRVFVRERQNVRSGLTMAQDISIYWRYLKDRRCVLHPFILTNTVGLFDVEVEIQRCFTSGDQPAPSATAGAARLAISKALSVTVPEYRDILKDAKLLYEDRRSRLRKQPGRLKARKIGQWRKR